VLDFTSYTAHTAITPAKGGFTRLTGRINVKLSIFNTRAIWPQSVQDNLVTPAKSAGISAARVAAKLPQNDHEG
jgi:hypothetical protein